MRQDIARSLIRYGLVAECLETNNQAIKAKNCATRFRRPKAKGKILKYCRFCRGSLFIVVWGRMQGGMCVLGLCSRVLRRDSKANNEGTSRLQKPMNSETIAMASEASLLSCLAAWVPGSLSGCPAA